jgi:hypothetical protein
MESQVFILLAPFLGDQFACTQSHYFSQGSLWKTPSSNLWNSSFAFTDLDLLHYPWVSFTVLPTPY